MARILASLCFWGLCAFSWPVWGMAPVDIEESSDGLHLFGAMAYLRDPGSKLSLEQVRRTDAGQFTPLTESNFARGISGDTYWIKTTIRNPGALPVDWVLYLRHGVTDFAEFWVMVDGRIATHAIGGDRTTLAERQIAYRYPAVRHVSQPGESATVFVRVANLHPGTVNLYFQLDSVTKFLGNATRDQTQHGVLYGVPLALALSALIGWAVSRDRRFSVYALYAISVVGSWIGLNGQLAEIFGDLPDLCNKLVLIFPLLNVVFSCVFARDFLHMRDLFPKSERFYQILMWCALGAIVLRLAGIHTASQLVMLLVVLSGTTAISAWLAMRKGVVYARWYLAAQLVYAGINSVSILAYIAGLYAPTDAVLYAEIAYFGELLMLSFAQYDRIRILQRDKEQVERSYQSVLETKNQELEAQVAERTRHLEQARRHAESLSRTDELTGLSNRREFFRRGQACSPGSGTLMLAAIDLDHFKRINDTYGHPAGDAVLRNLGALLKCNTRPDDVVSRLGGEEFAVLMRVPDVAVGVAVLERLRRAFEEHPTRFEGQALHHTLSIGYTVLDSSAAGKSLADMMAEADQALYAAKKTGRNTVMPFKPAQDQGRADTAGQTSAQTDCFSV